jgi:hypothetical protein
MLFLWQGLPADSGIALVATIMINNSACASSILLMKHALAVSC